MGHCRLRLRACDPHLRTSRCGQVRRARKGAPAPASSRARARGEVIITYTNPTVAFSCGRVVPGTEIRAREAGAGTKLMRVQPRTRPAVGRTIR
jgi:hypothetical protein